MKQKIIIISIALFITQLACQFAYAQENVVLQDNEIPTMIIHRPVRIAHWPIAIVKGMPVDTEGVYQDATIQGLEVSIKYTEFGNTNEAHQAVTWHSKNQQSIFYPGVWNGAQNGSIGDESWYSPNPGGGIRFYFVQAGYVSLRVASAKETKRNRIRLPSCWQNQLKTRLKKADESFSHMKIRACCQPR